MNIVVLAGGLSTERDVSFKTGDMVAASLRKQGHSVLLLDVFMGYLEMEMDISNIFEIAEEASVVVTSIPESAPDLAQVKASRCDKSDCFFGPNVIAICQKADIVFMALHGENGENGKIQAVFDLFAIRYTGSGYLSSAICMDKQITKLFLKQAGIPVPEGFVMKRLERCDDLAETTLTFPVVVKPNCGGSSIGVSIVTREEDYKKALDDAFLLESEVIIESYVSGREFSVGVIDGKALPVIEIAPITGFYDYKNKYKAGSAIETCPADLSVKITEQMQKYTEEAAKVLGLNTYARIDFLMNDKNELFCLEANTLPGMTPTSLLPQEAQAAGMTFEQLCEKIIRISIEERDLREKEMF